MSGGARRLSIRRRLDASALRWQARLDTAWVDRTLPWLFAALLAVILLLISLAVQRQLDGGPTLATWTQAAWNLDHGRGAVSSLAGGNMVLDQWAFTSWPLLWVAQLVPVEIVLAVAEALCLALAAVPIWRVAREVARLRLGLTAALVLAYGAAPVLYTANLTGWSPLVTAVPAIAWALWFGQRRRWIAYALCLGVALLSRADVGLVLVAIGVLGITSGDRRWGTLTAVTGGTWCIAFLAIASPEVPRAPMTASEAVLARGEAPLAVLADPMRLFTDLVIQPNVAALVVLVGPLLFLPLVVPRFALPALPPMWLGLVGEEAIRQAVGPSPGSDQLPPVLLLALVPIVLAAIVAYARIGRPSVSRIRVDHRVVAAMVLATVAIFVEVAPTSPFNEPWSWGSRDAADGARMEAVDVLDDLDAGGGVTASPQLTSLVAERSKVEEMSAGPPTGAWIPTTDAVLFDTTAVGDDGRDLWDRNDRALLTDSLLARDFRVKYRAEGMILLVRPPG